MKAKKSPVKNQTPSCQSVIYLFTPNGQESKPSSLVESTRHKRKAKNEALVKLQKHSSPNISEELLSDEEAKEPLNVGTLISADLGIESFSPILSEFSVL